MRMSAESGAPVLGVLGGMGPDATTDFLTRLIRLTPADHDQDHVPTLVYSDPTTPDRPRGMNGEGPSPLPAMLRGIEFLNAAGCAVIAVPCNNAHYWYDDLAAASAAPIPHIVAATATRAQKLAPGVRDVGVMANDGTTRARIYHDYLAESGLRVLDLTDLGPADPVTKGIRAVKAGDLSVARDTVLEGCRLLVQRGARALVVGCTDISAALADTPEVDGTPIVDSSDSLARASLERLGRATRHENQPVHARQPQ